MDGIWTTDELIDSLSKLPVLLPVVLADVDAENARFRPAEGEWSTVEVVGHLIDVEERALLRIALIQEQDNPELTGYDPDAMVVERGYQDQPLQPLVDRLLALRRRTAGGAARTFARAVGAHRVRARPGRHPVDRGNRASLLARHHASGADRYQSGRGWMRWAVRRATFRS